MDESIIEEYEILLKREKLKAIFLFFERLDYKERRGLVKTIRKADKYYSEILQKRLTWTSRGSAVHHQILAVSKFCCFTKREFVKNGTSWLQNDYVKKILNFYTPEWFSDYVNENLENWGAPFGMDYTWMMELKAKGSLVPGPELVRRLLPEYIYVQPKDPINEIVIIDGQKTEQRKHVWYCEKERLFDYPETLSEHIWLLFDGESTINWVGQYKRLVDDKSAVCTSWIQVLVRLTKDEVIDRERLLKANLGAVNMNFNRSLTGWFMDLFEALEPVKKEMMTLQSDMMAVFNSQQSRPGNIVLKHVKGFCTEPGFERKEFLGYVPMLLASETKMTINRTLMILDKLAKKYPKETSEICQMASSALIHEDNSIQLRVAKIIQKYGDTEDEALADEIANYRDILLSEPLELLQPFVASVLDEEEESLELPLEKLEPLSPENKIDFPQNLDDLVYLASQAFDNHDPLHFEILPAALLELYGQITPKELDRFGPALQRAFRLLIGDWRSGIGLLDHMLANFFIQFIGDLLKKSKGEAIEIRRIQNQYVKQDLDMLKDNRIFHSRRIFPFPGWQDAHGSPIHEIFFLKLRDTLKSLRKGPRLPLLSTPSHGPHWIDPEILIQRIKRYQDQGATFGHADVQLALARTWLPGAEKYVNQVKNSLRGEIRDVLLFLFEKEAEPKGKIETIAHWWTASISKSPQTVYKAFEDFAYSERSRTYFTGEYNWSVYKRSYQDRRWDYQKRKNVSYQAEEKKLSINLSEAEKGILETLSSLFSFKKEPRRGEEALVYENFEFKQGWEYMVSPDVQRFYSMVPNRPDKFLAKLISVCLHNPTFLGEDAKRATIKVLEQFLTISLPFGKMTHLFLAASLICSDKTARYLAGEVWSYGVQHNLIDAEMLGTYLGRHLRISFAPLKRITDLLSETMLRVSSKHDRHLQLMLEYVLLRMDQEPVRGLKKMLEIFYELQRRTKMPLVVSLEANLEDWIGINSLNKVAKAIQAVRETEIETEKETP